jgi:UDP-2,3-diacylglucosamine pyrophosphatase LpxH
MATIFLSDLHISSPLFKLESQIIDIYEDNRVKEVYILGDLFDTWEQNPYKTVIKRQRLIDVINNSGKTKIIIKGNHDPSIAYMGYVFSNVPVCDSYVMTLFDKKTILIHGDKEDSYLVMGNMFFPVHYVLQRVGINIKGFTRGLKYKLLKLLRRDVNGLVSPNEKKIVQVYGDKYELIIAGHTHVSKIIELNNCIYANCGCLVSKPSYLVADDGYLYIEEI